MVRFRLIFFLERGKVDEEKMHCHEQTDEYTHIYWRGGGYKIERCVMNIN